MLHLKVIINFSKEFKECGYSNLFMFYYFKLLLIFFCCQKVKNDFKF